MKNHRSFKLLSKTTLFYLLFTLLAFFISAVFLTRKANEFINTELEHRFHFSERRIQKHLERGDKSRKTRSNITLSEITPPPNADLYPIYSDTLMLNEDLGEIQRFRKKVSVIEIDGQFFQIIITLPMDDFYKLKKDIFGTLIPAFILLALGVVLFNYILSGYLFSPFYKILEQMKADKVGEKFNI